MQSFKNELFQQFLKKNRYNNAKKQDYKKEGGWISVLTKPFR
jgi:hypothetical protein